MREEIYERVVSYITDNQEKFYRFAYSYIKEREGALDIVQNAVCKALEKYPELRAPDKINAWFYRILVNEAHAYFKKQKREIATDDTQMPIQIYNETAFDKDDEVYDMVMKLPEKFKTVIVLRFFEDMSLEEISKVTSVNLSTVKTRLYAALRQLKLSYNGER